MDGSCHTWKYRTYPGEYGEQLYNVINVPLSEQFPSAADPFLDEVTLLLNSNLQVTAKLYTGMTGGVCSIGHESLTPAG